MRFVDVYTYAAQVSGMELIAADCRQLGGTDKPSQKRTPIARRYTMANGDPAVYPADKDALTCTVELECGKTQADAIGCHVHETLLVFAGLSLGCSEPQTLPVQTGGYKGIITSGVDICEKFSGTGIYCVTLPLQIMLADVSTPGAPAVVGVPAVKLSQEQNDTEQGRLTLGGNTEYLSRDYQYTRGGYFLRKSPYIVPSSTLTVTYTQHYAAGTPKHWALIGEAGITAIATGDTPAFPEGIVAADGVEPVSNEISLSIDLSDQTQDIELYTIRQTNVQRECKIVIPVYRKG